jgi:metal transporter CNNM
MSSSLSASDLAVLVLLDALLLAGAAMFAGLTLSVMGLDTLSLEIIATSGKDPDRQYARALLPVRQTGNRLLSTLILGNVMVNTLIAQITDRFVTGVVGTILSTTLITLGGEVIPQATMAAHALQVGATSVPLVRFFLFIFYPVCAPLALLLDKFVGTDPGQIYDRNELRKLMAVHASSHFSSTSGIIEQDLNVMLGAMDLHDKPVREAMTPLAEVYMVEAHEVLSDQFIHEIWESGHSRVPVHQGPRTNIVGLLFTKDLLLTRTDERITVLDLVRFYPRTCLRVMADTKLIVMLQEFRTGRSHLAVVREVIVSGSGDPHYETVGIVTMEDVVEELLRASIKDEFDQRTDEAESPGARPPGSAPLPTRPARALPAPARAAPGALEQKWLGLPKEVARVMRKTTLEDAHARVASLFLVESVAPFSGKDPSLVRAQLLRRDHVYRVKAPLRAKQLSWDNRANLWLYRQGVPTNFMVLVIAGTVEVFVEDQPAARVPSESFAGAAAADGAERWVRHASLYNTLTTAPASPPGSPRLAGSCALPPMDMGQWSVLGATALGSASVVPDFSARVVSNAVLLFVSGASFREVFP